MSLSLNLGPYITPRSRGKLCPLNIVSLRRHFRSGRPTITSRLSNHARPLTSSRPTTNVAFLISFASRTVCDICRQSNVPAGICICGYCFDPSALSRTNITLIPFHALGGSDTSSAFTIARSVANRSFNRSASIANRRLYEPRSARSMSNDWLPAKPATSLPSSLLPATASSKSHRKTTFSSPTAVPDNSTQDSHKICFIICTRIIPILQIVRQQRHQSRQLYSPARPHAPAHNLSLNNPGLSDALQFTHPCPDALSRPHRPSPPLPKSCPSFQAPCASDPPCTMHTTLAHNRTSRTDAV